MRNEAEVCTIIKNSFIAIGEECWKIPDPTGDFASTIKRPFDMFGSFEGNPLYLEVKYMNKMQSFNLNRIEDHQIEALDSLQRKIPTAHCGIALGIKVGRGDNRIIFFHNINEIKVRRKQKQNYLKKELESMSYFEIHSNLIDLIHNSFALD